MADEVEPLAVQLHKVTQALVAPGHGGSGYVLNDTVTLPDGVVVKATTMTGGAIASVTIQTAGSADVAAIPQNPVAQVSTSGAGTGAQFNLTWGPIGIPIDPNNPTNPPIVVGPATGIPGEPLIKTNAGHDYTLALPTFAWYPLAYSATFNLSTHPPFGATGYPFNPTPPPPLTMTRTPAFPAYPS